MLYWPLFWRIQSQALMTSLIRELPVRSDVRSETIGALRAIPPYAPAPAASPATIVPWPSSSWLTAVPLKSTLLTTRAPKSRSLEESTPLSTIAIAGAWGAGENHEPRSDVKLSVCCHTDSDWTSCVDSLTSGTIDATWFELASFSRSAPLSVPATPAIDWNWAFR